ncbi:hypothetical protein J4377_11655 [Halomonas sp. XH26]|uniref:hypothetical protein n=1 Tax=Halomonas sp. XH26 TaxID=2557993 RepID=UPI0020A0C8FA|nr:hypothetical protein [Halomonas sp. XH26]UTA78621.1 hypothetical protein J4377_11655 [Halomonas sp. XH26]
MIWAAKSVSDDQDFSRWGDPQLFYSLNEFEEYSAELFIGDKTYSIIENQSIIDIHLKAKSGKPLVVFFNGAQNRSDKYRFPAFSGLRVTPLEKASLLCIGDPSLYMGENIKIGWYAGSKFLNLQHQVIPEIINKIRQGIDASSLIFVGGSAGGTASLFYARCFPGAFCITSNPQTDILKYRKHHVNRYLRKCLGVRGVETAKKNPEVLGGVTTNIMDFYSGTLNNFTIYLQNREDAGHFETHFSEFLSSLQLSTPNEFGSYQLSEKLLTHVGDWGKGHKSAPRVFWANMLNNVVEHEGQWDTLFKEKRAHELLLPN